jgi:hypothetical protein
MTSRERRHDSWLGPGGGKQVVRSSIPGTADHHILVTIVVTHASRGEGHRSEIVRRG